MDSRIPIGILLVVAVVGFYVSEIHPHALFGLLISVSFLEIAHLIFEVSRRDRGRFWSVIISNIFKISILFLYGLLGGARLVRHYQHDKSYALMIISTVTISDILQYYAGKYIGRLRIGFPSPNKTIEGYIIGSVAAIVLSSITFQVCLNTTFRLVVYGILGDLFVSLIKRSLKIKDVSTLLGSHGGYLDRVDGIYMAYILENLC